MVTMLLVIYGLSPYLDESTVPNIVPAVAVLYGSLHRFAFAAALAWIIFACIHGYGGIYEHFQLFNAHFNNQLIDFLLNDSKQVLLTRSFRAHSLSRWRLCPIAFTFVITM